jgi:very-short-patch-repair endonuclease
MIKTKETIFNRPQYRNRRSEPRKNSTEPENRFWQAVRGQLGVKFRRQQGIGHYIVDFYCPEWTLVVELDGDSHFLRMPRLRYQSGCLYAWSWFAGFTFYQFGCNAEFRRGVDEDYGE